MLLWHLHSASVCLVRERIAKGLGQARGWRALATILSRVISFRQLEEETSALNLEDRYARLPRL